MFPPLLLLLLDLLVVFFFYYDHSSASVCVFVDADQGRENSHTLPTPSAAPFSTAAAATPTAFAAAPAASWKFQRYQCGRRMSNLFYDDHSVCSLFMGFVGTGIYCELLFFLFLMCNFLSILSIKIFNVI